MRLELGQKEVWLKVVGLRPYHFWLVDGRGHNSQFRAPVKNIDPYISNVTDRDLEIDRDMEHESDTDCLLINKRYLNNEHSN